MLWSASLTVGFFYGSRQVVFQGRYGQCELCQVGCNPCIFRRGHCHLLCSITKKTSISHLLQLSAKETLMDKVKLFRTTGFKNHRKPLYEVSDSNSKCQSVRFTKGHRQQQPWRFRLLVAPSQTLPSNLRSNYPGHHTSRFGTAKL